MKTSMYKITLGGTAMDDRKRLIKSSEIITSSVQFLEGKNIIVPFPYSKGIHAIFFADDQLDKFFVEMFPTSLLDSYIRFLTFMSAIGSQAGEDVHSANGISYKVNSIKEQLNNLLALIQSMLGSGGMFNIFYSWQSDLPNTVNRSFIENALNKAINQINNEIHLNLKLDQDTRGVAGSPDIIRAILDKIETSFMFVGDVSIVERGVTDAFPNLNVMFELGYAIKSLGDRNVLMVFNDATGATSELPFDLGLKRQLRYCCPENISPEDKTIEKDRLLNDFYNAINLVLKAVL
jgi:hypothetical protein